MKKETKTEVTMDIFSKDISVVKDELIIMASGLLKHWHPQGYLQKRMKETWIKKADSIMAMQS